MATFKNLDELNAFKELSKLDKVVVKDAMAGENGAKRVEKYSVKMSGELVYNFASKAVDDTVLSTLQKLADEAELTEKYAELYNGEIINTGEKRRVLHQLTRGQLGNDVVIDGVNKREFYVSQQKKIAVFADKVHNGQIVNEKGEKFTTAVQIGIGGSVSADRISVPEQCT